jgi:hypothetical protein
MEIEGLRLQSGIFTTQNRPFKSFGKMLVAKALAISIVRGLAKSYKCGSATAKIRNSPPTAGTSPGEPQYVLLLRRSVHSIVRTLANGGLISVFLPARTLDPLALRSYHPAFSCSLPKRRR